MIVYLKGKLTDINPTSVILETSNGIGYLVQITFELELVEQL